MSTTINPSKLQTIPGKLEALDPSKVKAIAQGQVTTLFPGQFLQPGDVLNSFNGDVALTLQADGNVVLLNNAAGGVPYAATGTNGISPEILIMQTDGNLVLYDTSGIPRFASGTHHPSVFCYDGLTD